MGKNKKSKQIATLNPNKNKKVSKKQDSFSDELIVSELRAIAMAECFSGPLPPPEILERYEKIKPGLADRIVCLAEEQQHHRIKTEDAFTPEIIKVNQRGQIFAFVITLVALGIMAYLASQGMEKAVIATALVLGGGIITTFISGKIEQNSNMQQKIENILRTNETSEDYTRNKVK